MALYSVSAGGSILAADLNQYKSFLTGGIYDQPATLGYIGGNNTRILGPNLPSLTLTRGAIATTSSGMAFSGATGATITHGIMQFPGNEDLHFGYDDGGSYYEHFKLRGAAGAASTGIRFGSASAGPPSASVIGAGMRISLYGAGDTTDQTSFAMGIDSSTLWQVVPSGSTYKWYAAGTVIGSLSAAGLSWNSTPSFFVDWGYFTHSFGGGPDNFTVTMNRNTTGKSNIYVWLSRTAIYGTDDAADQTTVTSVSAGNPGNFGVRMKAGTTGQTYAYYWFMVAW